MKKIFQWIKNLKLRNKLYLIYLAAGLLPLLLVGIYCCYFVNQLLVEREVKNLQNSLNQAMAVVDNQLEIYENMSDYLAFNQAILQTVSYPYEDNYYEMYYQLSTVFDPMVTSLKYLHSDIRQVTIYADSDIERHDTTLAPLSEIEKKPWYQELPANGRPLWVMDQDKKEIFCVRKMPELEGAGGVIYLEADYEKLFEPLTQMLDENYGVCVQEKGQMVFSHQIFEEPYSGTFVNCENLSSLKNSGNSQFIFVDSDLAKDKGLYALLYRPISQIEETIAPMMKGLVIICLLSVLIAGLLLTRLTGGIVTNIEKLTRNMQEVKKGNLKVTVTSDTHDEIGELVRGFGDMVEYIKTLIEKVYEGRISLKEYEMKALQAQINPHFLYNSLSLINWKAIEADEKDISKITLALSKFYRTALNKGNNVLPLEDEISNVKSYLDIQLMMHDYEFDVEINIDQSMYIYDTPNLILQPLIENAIDHGIDLKTEGRGKITIRGWQDEKNMYLCVEDNGVGMEEEVAKSILTVKSKGYGVRNVNERIRLIYGPEYGLSIASKVGEGTKITIRFPIVIRKGEAEV